MANALGTFNSLPSPSTFTAGDIYRTTDSPYYFICSGSGSGAQWNAFYGDYPVIIPQTIFNALTPNTYAPEIVQQEGNGYVSFTNDTGFGASTADLNGLLGGFTGSLPATPYTITCGFDSAITLLNRGHLISSSFGLGVYDTSADSTNYLGASIRSSFSSQAFALAGAVWITSDTFNSLLPGGYLYPLLFPRFSYKIWFSIDDNGSTFDSGTKGNVNFRMGIDPNNLILVSQLVYNVPSPSNAFGIFWEAGNGIDAQLFHLVIAGAPPALAVGCSSTTGVTGTPYSSLIPATGGVAPYTFAIITGGLPTGLSLNTSSGLISGTPTVAGTYPFTVQVTDSASTIVTNPCSILITTPAALSLACASSVATLTIPYSSPLIASGGTPSYTYAIISGGLPLGLNLNTSTGVISGTPVSIGTFNFTSQVTDSLSNVATSPCSIIVTGYPPAPPLPPSPNKKCNPNGGLL